VAEDAGLGGNPSRPLSDLDEADCPAIVGKGPGRAWAARYLGPNRERRARKGPQAGNQRKGGPLPDRLEPRINVVPWDSLVGHRIVLPMVSVAALATAMILG
jgi:hypothetical protein